MAKTKNVDIVRVGAINTFLRWESSKLPIDDVFREHLNGKTTAQEVAFFAHLVNERFEILTS
jgi:hypothetical protein